jgi:hypothetical protein
LLYLDFRQRCSENSEIGISPLEMKRVIEKNKYSCEGVVSLENSDNHFPLIEPKKKKTAGTD